MINPPNAPIFWVLFFLATGLVCTIDIFVYPLLEKSWPNSITCATNCVLILIASNPELIGNQAFKQEWRFPTPTFFNDKEYVLNSMHAAMRHYEPHVIIFMGRMFHDKSPYDSDFVERPSEYDTYILGDDQNLTREKMSELQFAFQTEHINYKNELCFIKFDSVRGVHIDSNPCDGKTTILVSHLNLLEKMDAFRLNAMREFNPKMILSVHEKGAKYIETDMNGKTPTIESFTVDITVNLSDVGTLKEVSIPTCSFAGIGQQQAYALVALHTDTLEANVYLMWLPSKFINIAVYLVAVYFGIAAVLTTYLSHSIPNPAPTRAYAQPNTHHSPSLNNYEEEPNETTLVRINVNVPSVNSDADDIEEDQENYQDAQDNNEEIIDSLEVFVEFEDTFDYEERYEEIISIIEEEDAPMEYIDIEMGFIFE